MSEQFSTLMSTSYVYILNDSITNNETSARLFESVYFIDLFVFTNILHLKFHSMLNLYAGQNQIRVWMRYIRIEWLNAKVSQKMSDNWLLP